MNNFLIKKIKNSYAWDRYVFSHKKSGYCHLFDWTRIIRDTYNHKSICLAAVKKEHGNREKICGILPLYQLKSFTGNSRLVSIPFFDAAGILANDRETEYFLLKQIFSVFPLQMVSGIELRQNYPLKIQNMEICGKHPEIYTAKTGMLLDLEGSQRKVMAGFKSKLRSQIKKGKKNNLCWRIGKKELLNPFYEVFSRNMRDLGSPVHSKKLFNSIFNRFYHRCFICVIFYKSKPVAASFMFRFKKRLVNPWASSLKEFRHLNSNMYLYWQMIKFACNIGMHTFDMGRSSMGAPTYRFKRQWGPCENRIFWYNWAFKEKNIFDINETLSIESWKKLPVPMANIIGPFVRRNISL